MNKALWLLLIFAAEFCNAHTGLGGTTTIQADWRCEQSGGGLAIKMPTQGSPARIWQSDVGQSDGLELQVIKFQVRAGQGSFGFEAKLFDTSARGTVVGGVLNYELFDSNAKVWTPLLKDVRCVPVSHRF